MYKPDPPSSFARKMAEDGLRNDLSQETDEFILGVIDGFHRYGKDSFNKLVSVRSSWGLCHIAVDEMKRNWEWDDTQSLDYLRGFLAGYRVRQNRKSS